MAYVHQIHMGSLYRSLWQKLFFSLRQSMDVRKCCERKLDFLWKFFLLLSDLCLSWHLLCPYAEKTAKTLRQGDAELMMQETLAGATSLPQWTLHGQIVTCRPSHRIHAAQQTLSYFIPRHWILMAYLAMQAFHFIELIPPFAFCFAVCSHIHLFTMECVSW